MDGKTSKRYILVLLCFVLVFVASIMYNGMMQHFQLTSQSSLDIKGLDTIDATNTAFSKNDMTVQTQHIPNPDMNAENERLNVMNATNPTPSDDLFTTETQQNLKSGMNVESEGLDVIDLVNITSSEDVPIVQQITKLDMNAENEGLDVIDATNITPSEDFITAQIQQIPKPDMNAENEGLDVIDTTNTTPSEDFNTVQTKQNPTQSDMNDKVKEKEMSKFPRDCSWKCYLRQNIHSNVNLSHWTETMAINHYQERYVQQLKDVMDGKMTEIRIVCRCKIIVLAGPHKASSTALQSIAAEYSMMDNVPWKWTILPGRLIEKGLAPLAIDWRRKQMNQPNKYEKYKQIIKERINEYYEEGYNIILGSEEIDRITNPLVDDSLIDEFNSDILPAKEVENGHVTALVVYRAPRVDHLLSHWKEIEHNIVDFNHPTFRQFVCASSIISERKSFIEMETIDSLRLTQILLKKGWKVQLLDMSGVGVSSTSGVDLFSALGCDTMQMPCQKDDNDQLIPIAISQHANKEKLLSKMKERANVKSTGIMDVSNKELDQIEAVMKQYDCGIFHLLNEKRNDGLEILYGDILKTNWQECDNVSNETILTLTSHEEIVESITNILGC